MAWIVRLVKPPKINDFPKDFFPRRVHYKKDALELAQEVKTKGGVAIAEKDKNKDKNKE